MLHGVVQDVCVRVDEEGESGRRDTMFPRVSMFLDYGA